MLMRCGTERDRVKLRSERMSERELRKSGTWEEVNSLKAAGDCALSEYTADQVYL